MMIGRAWAGHQLANSALSPTMAAKMMTAYVTTAVTVFTAVRIHWI